jgi:hypothetical protein
VHQPVVVGRDEQLLAAAQSGDVGKVRAALDSGANRECMDVQVRPVAAAHTAACLRSLRPHRSG